MAQIPQNKDNKLILKLIDNIKENSKVEVFFKHLWEDEVMARLFFAHRDILFFKKEENNTQMVMPYLCWDNQPLEFPTNHSGPDLLSDTSDLREIEQQKLINKHAELFEGIESDFKDLSMYYLIKFIRENKDILEVVEDKEFSFERMKEILKDYKGISLDIFDELKDIGSMGEYSSDKTNENKIRKIVRKYSINIKKVVLDDPLQFIKSLDVTNRLPQIYFYGSEHWRNLVSIQQIQPDNYFDMLSNLYRSKLIGNLGTVFYCVNCQDEPFIATTTSRISPKHLGMVCPKCQNNLAIGSIYEIHPLVKKSILYKDGLLGVAVAWLLNNKNIKFRPSMHSSRHENDFVCETKKGNIIIECKMHKTGKDDDSVKANIINDVQQIIAHVKSLEEDGHKITQGYVVCNYILEDNERIINSVYKSRFKKDIETHNIKIIDYTTTVREIEKVSKI